MLIYLLRHGIAEDPAAGQGDHERALTDEGWKRLRRAAPAWRQLCEVPAVVFVSPLRRAQETASVLQEALRGAGELRTEPALVPGASTSVIMRLLEAEQFAGTKCVALVGHEPHLGYLLGGLLTGHPRLAIPLKKGMLVAVETESTASLVAGLRWSLTQRAAAALGG
jgi:phosphohistidine phosphatase